jgi:hypothetical protein
VEAALAEPECFPLKKNRTASPHPKTALLAGERQLAVTTRPLAGDLLPALHACLCRPGNGWIGEAHRGVISHPASESGPAHCNRAGGLLHTPSSYAYIVSSAKPERMSRSCCRYTRE